jgi:hypothetical protein
MRTLVQPPPASGCDLSHGKLLFKRIEPDGPALELNCEIFVRIKCGHEQSYRVNRSLYATRSGGNRLPPKRSVSR